MSYVTTLPQKPLFDVPPSAVPSTVAACGVESPSLLTVVELILKNRRQLNDRLRSEAAQRDLAPRLMAVAMIGFGAFGVVLTLFLNALRVRSGFWLPYLPPAHWNDASAGNLAAAYALGLIAANGICLPSFYFYGLLAGLRITMLEAAVHAMKGMAASAVALVGLLPVYVALVLPSLILEPNTVRDGWCVAFGLSLPFVAGFVGAANLYEGFVALADAIRCAHAAKRTCLLRRLLLAWCGCMTFVTPLVIFSLWDLFGQLGR